MIALIEKIKNDTKNIEFTEVIACIDKHFDFSETAFQNGPLKNEAGQNSGSCKVFSFAQIHQLDKNQTLACFGKYYRQEVLENPEGQDHQNIRNFIKTGWEGIQFYGQALKPKTI